MDENWTTVSIFFSGASWKGKGTTKADEWGEERLFLKKRDSRMFSRQKKRKKEKGGQ